MTNIEKRIAERYKQKALESLETQRLERQELKRRIPVNIVPKPQIITPKQPKVKFSFKREPTRKMTPMEKWERSIDAEMDYAIAHELLKP